jgi:AcrR family transcriptional regulator
MPRRADETREKLLDAALQLFSERGWRNTPTAEISRRAGVATGTLFNHFPSKDNLVKELFLSIKADQSAAVAIDFPQAASARDRVQHAWQAVSSWSLANPLKHTFACDCKSSRLVPEDVLEQSRELFCPVLMAIEEAVQSGELRDIPRPLLLAIMGAIYEGQIHLLAEQQDAVDVDAYINLSFDVLWNGLKAPEAT